MYHTTEYASKFVWHENAYIKPPLQKYRQTWNLSESGKDEEYKRGSLYYLLQKEKQNQQHQHQQDLEETKDEIHNLNENGDRNEIMERLANACCLHKKSLSLSSLRPYPMELNADTRGIKSHFLPAHIEVLLDLGLSRNRIIGGASNDGDQSCRTRTSSQSSCSSNQYFTSVYKRDFARKKSSFSS